MSHASCCVLSFERLRLLRSSLESLIANAGEPLELIVHDDGSTDPGVVQHLNWLLDTGGVSTLILNPPGHNQGQGVALNRMFSIATGDPIIKLDQDLLYKPNWLGHARSLLEENADIGLLGLMHYFHDPVDATKTFIAEYDGWTEHTHILGSAFAVSRACWAELGPFGHHNDAFAEDWEFQRAVTASDAYCCGLPEVDLVENMGMGYELSTVNVSPGVVQSIHHGPHLLCG